MSRQSQSPLLVRDVSHNGLSCCIRLSEANAINSFQLKS